MDVRLVAATHHDLPALVREKKFRSDLYFRISTLPLRVPPLAERGEDLPVLAEKLFHRIGGDLGRPGLRLSGDALSALQGYAWPGNVRELRNVLERAALFCKGDEVGRGDLRFGDLVASPPEAGGEILPLAEHEKRYLTRVLSQKNGRVEDAARALKMPRSSLYDRLRKYGITWQRDR